MRFSSLPLVLIGLTVITAAVGRDWFVVVVWGPLIALAVMVSWRPFRLQTALDRGQIEYLKGFQWHRLPASEIAALRYEHGLLDGRGRAVIRADTNDGRIVRIPGTAGIYWFRSAPEFPEAAIPPRRLHVVSTVQMLGLVSQRLGLPIDTYDAISMNPRR